jgi:hypothetical protein
MGAQASSFFFRQRPGHAEPGKPESPWRLKTGCLAWILKDDIDDIPEVVHQPRASICMAMAFCSRQQSGNILFIFYGIFSLKHRQPVSGFFCCMRSVSVLQYNKVYFRKQNTRTRQILGCIIGIFPKKHGNPDLTWPGKPGGKRDAEKKLCYN